MRTYATVLVLLAACRGQDAPQPGTSDAQVPSLAVSPDGVGPVKTGWTLQQLNSALGEQLRPTFEVNPECDYLDPAALPPGIGLMIVQDTVVRIDVDTTGIPTTEGAVVGDTEARVLELYRGRIEVQPHKVTILADTAARAKDLDEASALVAKQRAEEALKDRVGAMEVAEAQAELARAAAQLKAIEKLRKMRKGGG